MTLRGQQPENTMRVKGERVRAARKLRSVSQEKLAELIGTSSGMISQVETERAGTSVRMSMALAQALNVSMDYLVGWVEDPTPTKEILTRLRATAARLADAGLIKMNEDKFIEVDTEDFVGVNEIIASAGTGREVISEQITDRVKFRRPWLRKHGLKGYLCRLIKVIGESMEPTLPEGSSILIDMGQQEPRDGRIFVIRIEDEIVVKRAIHDRNAGWMLQSDNRNKRAWPTLPWPAEARIVGEVKWVAHSFA